MKLIDVHSHLESDKLWNNLDNIIDDAKKTGIVKIITSSVDPKQWEQSALLAGKYGEVEYSLGIHPWYASLSDLDSIEELVNAKSRGAIAIGEIGLDKKIDNPSLEVQSKVFNRQLEIAGEINLPVIIHCRGAFTELIESIKKTGLPEAGGVVHAFSGSREIAEELIKLGLSFSLGGTLTFKLSKKRIAMINRIYPDYFMLETDSPDILPMQINEGPNVPSNILFNLKSAAEILGVPEEEVAQTATDNAIKMFKLQV
ncbi:TatD family hydrolase [Spirochaetota bacterium]